MGRQTRPSSRRERQTDQPNTFQVASERGVNSVRRILDPESQQLFQQISDNLDPELLNAGRLFAPSAITMTVIGFSRYTDAHKLKGAPTERALQKVSSANNSITATIGEIGMFGSDTKHKLAFKLVSPEMTAEVRQFEQVFKQLGNPLQPDFNSDSGEPNPHCSIALMFEDQIGHFEDPRTLDRLGSIAVRGLVDTEVTFLRVKLPEH